MSVSRRQFIKYLAVTVPSLGATLAGSQSYAALASDTLTDGRQMRVIPSTGEKIPAIGLGSWLTFAIDVDDVEQLDKRVAILREFMASGGGVLDSSPMYGVAQQVIGIALQRIGGHEGLFAATKVWTSSDRQGFLQIEDARRLWGLELFDLLQVHNLLDWQSHLPNLLDMKQQGNVRYVGVTTSHGRRHQQLAQLMRTQPLDFVQFTYNMLDREAEKTLLPLAQEKGIAVIINRPFQRGGLFERFSHHRLPEWADELGCNSWASFFLKFIISHPAVTCTIPATSQLPHLRENLAAGYGPLPDRLMREKMLAYVQAL